jgi:hypothetical protein
MQKIIGQVEKLTDIGIALSAEKDTGQLLEKILLGAKSITNSDGGTIYRVDGNAIKIEIIRSDSLGISLGEKEAPLTFRISRCTEKMRSPILRMSSVIHTTTTKPSTLKTPTMQFISILPAPRHSTRKITTVRNLFCPSP